MQFKVPQFIDIEDKILGPLTWKQFAYCLGAAGITYISLRLTGSRILGLIIAAPFAGLFLALAFVKVNNRSFIEVLEHGFNYFSKSNIYTWQKNGNKNQTQDVVSNTSVVKNILPEYERKNLRELATNLDTKSETTGTN